jgi:hypothetical protein
MSTELEQDLSYELNERLRMETGWNDVVSGLAKVLWGYLVFIIGTIVGVGLVELSYYHWMFEGGTRATAAGRLPSLGALWMFYIGGGILSVVGTFGYLITMAGQWRCMQGASERHGARWMMFFCLTCLFAAPTLTAASGIGGGMKRGPDLQKGARSFREMQFTPRARYMQLAGAACGLMYSVFFLLFLRAVARCHGSAAHVTLVNFFLVFAGVLCGLTVYVSYMSFRDMIREDNDPRLWILGAWGVCFFFYLFLIGSIRSCVIKSLSRVRSPLDM